jgi:hypothetical protein
MFAIFLVSSLNPRAATMTMMAAHAAKHRALHRLKDDPMTRQG